MTNKILFKFNIQSISDVITNSSSELFVFKNKSSYDEVIELLNRIYPDWRNEYEEPVQAKTLDDLGSYLDWIYTPWSCYENKKTVTRENSIQTKLAVKFHLQPKDIYENWKEWDPKADSHKLRDLRLSEKGIEMIREKMSDNEWALYSITDNPDWDYQEKLMKVASRYHLG